MMNMDCMNLTTESTEHTEKGEASSLTGKIIGAAIEIHRALGPGLLESTYEACLIYELRLRKLKVEPQKAFLCFIKMYTLIVATELIWSLKIKSSWKSNLSLPLPQFMKLRCCLI